MGIDEIQAEINALKILLAQTDYVALKVAEAEMYGEMRTSAPLRALMGFVRCLR